MSSPSPRKHQSHNHFTDPTEFEDLDLPVNTGVLPFIDDQPPAQKDSRSNAATGASAAGVRAFTAQAIAFYFRAPAKAFFRTRVDYLVYARSISQEVANVAVESVVSPGSVAATASRQRWIQLWRNSTLGLLTHAVKSHGWRVIPEQVLPPLMANVAVGAVLYTSYLQILGRLHEPSNEIRKRVYPPPSLADTFTAGFLAGGVQSLVAAPLDALMVRYERSVDVNGNGNSGSHSGNRTIVAYGREKLGEIGVRGIFAGWGLSFAKDSLGSGVFFGCFEWVKAQGYYSFVKWYYGALKDDVVDVLAQRTPEENPTNGNTRDRRKIVIKPHYAIEPGFLLLAGVTATIAQQSIIFPLNLVQQRHFERLEDLDHQARNILNTEAPKRRRGMMLKAYYHAYQETWRECCLESASTGSMRKWLFQGFWWSTTRQVPSTAAGLIIFELVRRKYGLDSDEVRISKDGYDILLK